MKKTKSKSSDFITILFCITSLTIFAQDPHNDENSGLKSNSEQNLNTTKTLYNGFAKGDIPSVLGTMDEKIVWNEAENFPYADRNPYIGKEAILNGVFARIGGEWENFTISDMQFYPMENNMILVTGYYNGKCKKTGKTIKAQMAHLWWLKNGKFVKFQQYTDTKQVADAITN